MSHHHHHIPKTGGKEGILILSIVLNLLFVAVEAAVGLLENSLSLLSYAGHNLSDGLSHVMLLVALKL